MDYSSFFSFISDYLHQGYESIDKTDRLILNMEEALKLNKQFFFLADLIQIKIKFCSSGSKELLGIDPEQVDPSTFYTRTHPDILLRHNVARTKLFNLGQELYITKQPFSIISTNLKFRNASGDFSDYLVQCYLFYSEIPYKTVFLLQVMTNLDEFHPIRYGYHFYLGTDKSYFRYPDTKLLNAGNVFSKREFEILNLLAQGKNSHQIAEELFLSTHTVNTHRRNLLKKSGRPTTNDLILSLKERGVI
jgi:DNA-binding CsgD family transcriptional regulator